MGAGAPALLIVDDIELNRAMLFEMLRNQFEIIEAKSGQEALEILSQLGKRIALVLIDMVMPGMDGLALLSRMRAEGHVPGIPVMMIVPESQPEQAREALKLGAVDFIERPFNADIIKARATQIIKSAQARFCETQLPATPGREAQGTSRLAIEALATIVEFRSGETALHARRVGLMTRLLCQALRSRYAQYEMSDGVIEDIVCASALHDVGMIAVPESILTKPGPLTHGEFETIKQHTIFGARMIERMGEWNGGRFFPFSRDICLFHHERWDGSGYPHGLSGDEIPIWAQVVSLADVYDVLTGDRVYKHSVPHEKALEMIQSGECGAFNPKLMAALETIGARMLTVLEEIDSGENAGAAEEQLSARTINLIESERAQYRTFASLSGEVLFDYDCAGDRLTFSERFSDCFEGDMVIEGALKGGRAMAHVHRNDQGRLGEAIARASAGAPILRLEIRILTKRGWYEWYEVVAQTLWTATEPAQCLQALGKLTNIDKSVRETTQLREQATRDVLTGLFNRVESERRIRQRLKDEPDSSGALLYIDVDDFKTFNDSRGHLYGDEVLRMVGRTIMQNIRDSDIAGRIGGDEFIVYLDRVHREKDVIGNARRLIAALEKGRSVQSESVAVSVSIGIARCPKDGIDYESLLEKADKAMYRAKHNAKRGAKGSCAFYKEPAISP
jgi:diguanylate cyclase (GGDEF)-like protein